MDQKLHLKIVQLLGCCCCFLWVSRVIGINVDDTNLHIKGLIKKNSTNLYLSPEIGLIVITKQVNAKAVLFVFCVGSDEKKCQFYAASFKSGIVSVVNIYYQKTWRFKMVEEVEGWLGWECFEWFVDFSSNLIQII